MRLRLIFEVFVQDEKHLSTFLPTISYYVFSNTEDFLSFFPLQES